LEKTEITRAQLFEFIVNNKGLSPNCTTYRLLIHVLREKEKKTESEIERIYTEFRNKFEVNEETLETFVCLAEFLTE
jgi:hypothetical protein